MFALFLARPHHVVEIEASVADALGAHRGSVQNLEKLSVGDGAQSSVLLKVRR
jgi:hypothetical protein